MKRSRENTFDGQQRSRRQPQISCNFCRQKKLKCDRGNPCTTCTVRGFPCTIVSSDKNNPPQLTNNSGHLTESNSIRARLQSLEQAVFSPGAEVWQRERASSPRLRIEPQQTARLLDSSYTKHDSRLPQESSAKFCLRSFMTREEALSLLEDFVDNPYHLLPIIDKPTIYAIVDEFFIDRPCHQKASPASAALILSIFATSASFFNKSMVCHHGFASNEKAAKATQTWRESAMHALHTSPGTAFSCLEGVQAWAILAYLIYNAEGCSALFRYLHSCSVGAAREISLHLIDSPTTESQDTVPIREIKRRLWWHIASTDWMLGLMGGPLDGTYTVQPRHMNVRYPRNLNDNDLSMCDDTFTFPQNVATQVSVFLQRIRLAQICRSAIDARNPGAPEAEVVDYNKVLSLDRLFEHTLSEFPPFLQPDAPIPPGAPRHLSLQRSIIQIGFHSRRARLHRPFLVQETQDDRYQFSRNMCLRSALTVLSISTSLLENSLSARDKNHEPAGQPLTHRLGILIGHLFMACTVLALYAGLSASRTEEPHTSLKIHTELKRACRILARVGEESTVAARLVGSLTGVLRRYHVDGVEDIVDTSNVHCRPIPAASVAEPSIYREGVDHNGAGDMAEDSEIPEVLGIEGDILLGTLWGDYPSILPDPEAWDHI